MTVHTKQSSELPDAVVVVGVCDTSSTATSSAAASASAAATNHQQKRKTKKGLPAVIEIEDEHGLEQGDHSSSSSSDSDILVACSRSPLSMDHLDDGDDDGDHRPPSLSSLSFISSSSRSLSLSTCCSSSSSLLSSSFYSGTNSLSSGSRSTVSFEDNVSIKEIPNGLYDYTKREVQASWYTRSELAKQRRTSRNLAETMDFYSDEELFDRFGVQSVQKFMDRFQRIETSKNLFFRLDYDEDDEEEEEDDEYDSRIAAASQYARDFTSISLESSRTAREDAERIASQLYGGGK
mmetsp:Transcript_38853/g.94055  ORF Transcript_38853/g.94055 Transcript_38853/m.94055 type:complete len:293 (-) Transcript_38853:50-928(-)